MKVRIKEIIKRLREETEYQQFFQKAMKKFGINAPSELGSAEKKKEFFDYIDANWKAGQE